MENEPFDSTPESLTTPPIESAPIAESVSPVIESPAPATPPSNKRKKIAILVACLSAVVLIAAGVLVWMFAFAPAATIDLVISRRTQKFSENLSFVDNPKSASPDDGVFALSEIKAKDKTSVDFNATGSRNDGEKAKGEVKLYFALQAPGTATIPADQKFTTDDGLVFVTTKEVKVTWDGKDNTKCLPYTPSLNIQDSGFCLVESSAKVTADAPGTQYNIDAKKANQWDLYRFEGDQDFNVNISNPEPFTGGTDKNTKIVEQSDIDTATVRLKANENMADELAADADASEIPILSTFRVSSAAPVSEPAVGGVVRRGEAKLTMENTYSLKVASRDELKEYIERQVTKELGHNDQKVYGVKDITIKNFNADGTPAFAKVQAEVETGPSITEEEVLSKVLGAKVGQVKTLLGSINGIADVRIKTSYPWVGSIPQDRAKVNITIEVEH